MRYYVGPMEGITNSQFRLLHRKYFPGADKYFAPFLSPTRDFRFTPRILNELLPELGAESPLVPQLLANSADNFLPAARELGSLGFGEVNFNLGCPSRTVTAKRKGAALLAEPAALNRILDQLFSALGEGPPRISIKTRMGIAAPEEFPQLIEVFNRYPIAELTVHARVQEDFYRRPACPEKLAGHLQEIRVPFCYNGDLLTVEDADRILPLFSGVSALMLGRGVVRDPALILRLRGTPAPERDTYCGFLDELLDAYRAAGWDQRAILCHMKEIWSYMIGLFENAEQSAKRLQKAKTLEQYQSAVAELFQHALSASAGEADSLVSRQ